MNNNTKKPTIVVNNKNNSSFKRPLQYNKPPLANIKNNTRYTGNTANSRYNYAFFPNNMNNLSPQSVNTNISNTQEQQVPANNLRKNFTVTKITNEQRALFPGLQTLSKNLLASIGMAGGRRFRKSRRVNKRKTTTRKTSRR
jgi:hypothetical protein